MSHQAQYQTLFSYHTATFNQLLDCAEQLDEEVYKCIEDDQVGSIHDVLFHALFWHNLWWLGLEGHNNNPGLQAGDFNSITALRAGIVVQKSFVHHLPGS